MAAIGVLGPVALDGPDGPIRLGSARLRRLLAALVANLGTHPALLAHRNHVERRRVCGTEVAVHRITWA